MRCPRCQNEDKEYFYKGSKGWICRKCIKFKRQCIEDELQAISMNEIQEKAYDYTLNYPLTEAQKKISKKCLLGIQTQDVFIDAICGAGKTELVVETIAYYLKQRKKVAFAIARRQVVLELQVRLSTIFKNAHVIAMCQGYTSDLEGDLIICTTHQLYRYPKTFDLVILDEPDAFPYKGNKVLEGIVNTSCKGRMIYLTATADETLKKRIEKNEILHLKLSRRPHQNDLIVPQKIVGPNCLLLVCMLYWIKKHDQHKVLIFVPTIKDTIWMRRFVGILTKSDSCHSKTENKDDIIKKFKNGEIQCLIATTILERGITIEGIDVCVYHADHGVFDEASLIQMSGRVGRSFNYPNGDCLFLCNTQSHIVNQCISTCKRANYEK